MSRATGLPAGYSATQITLHWIIALLILVQFLFSEGMEHAWDAFEDGEALISTDMPMAYLHIGAGVAVLVLAFARVWLRLAKGAPALPESDPVIMRIIAHMVHGLLYLLIFMLPISGAVAWFGGVEPAADAHKVLKTLLLVLVVLHVAGALFQQFLLRSGVLMRMLRPAA